VVKNLRTMKQGVETQHKGIHSEAM